MAKPSYFGNPSLDHAVAGIGAATVSTITLQPLDLIKTRLQLDDATPRRAPTGQPPPRPQIVGRAFRAFRAVLRQDGLRGFYRGLSPNLAGNTASWGLYFFWYDTLKRFETDRTGRQALSPTQHLTAAAAAGALTQLCANPLWVVKTRMFATDRGAKQAYRGLWHGLTSIYRYEGVRGLYKGLVPGLFGVSHGSLQFMAYEEMKRWRAEKLDVALGTKLNAAEYMGMAAGSKVFATVCTYPYQVIRTRLQNQITDIKYTGVLDAITKIYHHEGLLGFYKGLGPNIVRVLPGTCITFVVYETLSHYFQASAQERAVS
ncbi:mitochondrial FAD carrier protein flx1 [Tieghemiomyces parasiticus]|uniref:Mitochondrial FAD carrier protein flx1 n=1 Tax=Tieghemiomyces parasiticus TaxID=78921 RepID=A0A9W8ADL0_9FUNG|nr:mitochondrial FAD carrier protein flx1 [Tieghemiomyces parasiticus]